WELAPLAFSLDPAAEERGPAGPPPAPQRRTLWDVYLTGPPRRSAAEEQVLMYLNYEETVQRIRPLVNVPPGVGSGVGIGAAAALGRGLLTAPPALFYLMRFPDLLYEGPDPASAAAPLLAVRAGWRAVADS